MFPEPSSQSPNQSMQQCWVFTEGKMLSEFVQTEAQMKDYPRRCEHSSENEKKIQCEYSKKKVGV